MATEIEMAAARRKIAEIAYEFGSRPEEDRAVTECGWLNGKVTLKDGRQFAAGGGWVDTTGLVEGYNYRDAGQVDELAEALGLDTDETLRLLRDDCPAEWAPYRGGA